MKKGIIAVIIIVVIIIIAALILHSRVGFMISWGQILQV